MDDAWLRQLWTVFSAESRDYVQTIAAGALELERGVDPSLLERLRRAAHSLKGTAATLGLESLERIAHTMEEGLAQARSGTAFPATSVQALLASARSVEEILDRGDGGELPAAGPMPGLLAVLGAAPDLSADAQTEHPAGEAAPASGILDALAAHLRRLASPFVPDREHEIAAGARRARELAAHGQADRCEQLARSFEAMGGGGTEAPRAVAAAAGILVELRRALGGPGPAAAPRRPSPGERAVRVSAAAIDAVARHVELLAVAQARVEPRARSLLAIHAACVEALRAAAGEGETSGTAPGLERLRELVRAIGSLGREALHEAARQRVEAAALREDLRALRMIPAAAALEPLRRTAREAAGLLGKEVALALSGTEVKIDRHVVEELRPALVHLVRNAVDHGIELPAARGAAGKPAVGTVRVEVEPRGSRVAVVVADDGAGVDVARIREKAVRSALASQAEAATLDEAACFELLFRPGFSTADEVTSVSGRGVGLDVVRDVVTRLQGTVSTESTRGKGTRFLLDLPLTLATTSGILLRLGGTLAAVPSEAVERVLRLRRADLGTVAGRASARIGEGQIPYAPLGQVLGMPQAAWGAPAAEVQPAIVLGLGGERMALGVDEVLGKQELVVSSLGRICAPVAHLAGAALLEEGSLVGVLNAAEILARARRGFAAGAAETPRPRILVADDSPTTRAAMTTILEIAGYAVAPAADGEEALRRLAESPCRLVVTDIQMPRLDGLDLTRRIRSDPQLRSMPVILVTSLDSPDDRAAGLEAGADAYLVKREVERGMLLEMVRRLLPESP